MRRLFLHRRGGVEARVLLSVWIRDLCGALRKGREREREGERRKRGGK